MKTSRKILLSMAAVGAAASIAGLGTYATFTDSTSATQTVTSGTVDINLGMPGADNRLNVNASGLLPNDTEQRRVKLTNAGTENVPYVKLTTTATASSVLDTDATNGLQMKIEKCSGLAGWSESGTSPAFTYTCDQVVAGDNLGSRTTVLATQRVICTDLSLSNLSSTAAGATDDMVVTVSLPSGADNTVQGKSSTIQYSFTTTQRTTAANK
jgi:spore coat-associated protein N